MKINLMTIFLMVLLFMITNIIAVPVKQYDILLSYDNEKINVENITLIGSNSNIKERGDYYVEIKNDDKILDRVNFSYSNEIYYDSLEENTLNISNGGIVQLDRFTFNVKIPYFEDMSKIAVYDSDRNMLASKEISKKGSGEFLIILVLIILIISYLIYRLKRKPNKKRMKK